ncbi:hypothetical protein SAMN05444920_103255 [Nonomuraea solani]|uniref:Uncharacterized protein n=2 Tax=Nonomuraea solani TaxID=1144553 RepID=A0A1H6BB97_9ACTN|nr:hypothetical protein SAMN05444920_103255 [Nonomuraea solani]
MRKRVLVWSGAVVAVAALAGLGVYFVRVGLEEADRLASVIGVFVALAGLAVAIYGLAGGRTPEDTPQEPETPRPDVSASGPRSVAIGGDNSGVVSTGDGATNVQMRAEASGQGRIYQAGGDQTINEK